MGYLIIICVVVYSYFKTTTLDADDGVNAETPVTSSSEYLFAYYLVITAVVFTFLNAAVNSVDVFRYSRGGSSSGGLFGKENNNFV